VTDEPLASLAPHHLMQVIAKNTAFIMLGSAVLKAVNFLFGLYVVRRLGGDNFGRYSIVIAFVGVFQILAELGMSQYAMREIARDRTKTRGLFWNLVALRLSLALVGIIGITAAARLMGYGSALVLGVFYYTWTFVLSAFEAPLEAVLTANERLELVTVLTITSQLGFALLGAVVLLAGYGFVALIAVGLAAMLPQLALAVWMVRRLGLISWPPQIALRMWPALIKGGLPFGVSSLALTIAFSIDTVMLSRFQPPNVVGWYNVAYGLVLSLSATLNGFSRAIVPSLTKTFVGDQPRVENWFFHSVKLILMVSMPIAVGGTLIAQPLMRLLYGQTYLPASPALLILVWDAPVLMLASLGGNMTTITGEERAGARIYGISALANIALNLYFIPRMGFLGASYVTVLTDMIAALQFFFLLRRTLHLPNLTSVVARLLLCVGVMATAVMLVGSSSLFVAISVGAIVYGGLVLVLRLVDDTERDGIQRLLRKLGQLRTRPIAQGSE
jgi:O-antigen/teichoic acid export membrane protein